MAGFNRFGSGGFGSLYAGMGSLQQPSVVNRREDRFDNRRNSRDFDRRERDFGRRDPSPRRRRYSPDPPYSGLRGNRQDDRGGLGSYPMDDLGRDNFARNRGGQRSSDRDLMRDAHNIRPPNRGGDGILGAKPGDMPRDLTPNPSSGLTSQLAQQQQQLMAMVQTQSLLAAIQAQASAAAKHAGRQPPSLLQGGRMNDHRGRMGDRNNRKRRMSPPRGGLRNMNLSNQRQRRMQQNRIVQGNRSSYQQRKDHERDRKRVIESSQKPEENEPIEEPYVEETLDEEEEEKEMTKEGKTTKEEDKEATKKSDPFEKSTKSEEPKPEGHADEDQESPSETNLAGQNINNLVKSLYDISRRKYVCKVCKIMCTKESCFRQHLYGRRHVKTWLESRGQSFEAEMFRRASEEAAKSLSAKEQAKKPKGKEQEKSEQTTEEKQKEKEQEEFVEVKKEEEKEPSVLASSLVEETKVIVREELNEVRKEKTPPSEPKKPLETVKVKEEKVPVEEEKFEAKYSCDNRKVAMKEGEYITISSITEARVRLRGFDKGVNTRGCEFVKAVSGYNCRLCKTFILSGNDVMKHIEGRKHQAKYRRYINEHPKYESNQLVRNKELSEMLSEREGDEVLLYEVIEDEEPRRPPRHGSGEVSDVEVTKYVAAEEEPDEQSESLEDLLREETETSISSDKNDTGDDILNNKGGDSKDQEEVEMDGEDTIEEKYDPELEKKLDELMEEEVETKTTETREDPNTSVDSSESQEEEQEEPVEKKTKVATTAGRRGRKAARGGAQTSVRGRGRGGKRPTRQKATPKPEVASYDEKHDDFMDGFQVIDEVADDE